MQKLRKIIANLDIFVKNKLLRNILILSILAIIIYPVIAINVIYPVMTRSIVDGIKNEAQRLAFDMALTLGLSKGELGSGDMQRDLQSRVKRLEKKFIEQRLTLMNVKIYTKSGETIYSYRTIEIGEPDREKYFDQIIGKGIAQTNLLRKDVRLSDGQTRTVYIVETIVPIMRDNSLVGALEISYNITNKMRIVNRLAARFSTFLFVVGFGLMGTIIIMAHKMAETEEVISESKKEIHQAKQHLESLIESSTDAIIATDRDGNVVFFNSGAEALLGYRREEVIGRYVVKLYESEERAKEVMHRMREGGGTVSAFETTLQAKDGSLIPVLISASLLYDEDGQKAGTVGFNKDLRERKQVEEELRKHRDHLEELVAGRTAELGKTVKALGTEIAERKGAEEKLSKQRDHLEKLSAELARSNAELEEFSRVASHDLQEPLRKVQAFSSRLEAKCGEDLSDEGRDYLARMLNATERMQGLINSLLAFSRVTTTAEPYVPVDLAKAAREVVSDLEVRIGQIGGNVEVGDLPTIDADPTQMRQLLQNLIGNGLKFHRENEAPVVKVHGTLCNDQDGHGGGGSQAVERCQIIVEDNDIGFDEGYSDRIFGVFQRLHGRKEYEGSGIGLSVCRKIAERHGGSITAKSAPGEGATFIVTLPVKQKQGENGQ